VVPHAGHAVLASWEEHVMGGAGVPPARGPQAHAPCDPSTKSRDSNGLPRDSLLKAPSFVIITQNVDGLHHRAGSRRVIELHGRLDRTRCAACDYEAIGLEDLGEDPRCPTCADRLRPGVVWFGEMLPAGALDQAMNAAAGCDVMLVIGT